MTLNHSNSDIIDLLRLSSGMKCETFIFLEAVFSFDQLELKNMGAKFSTYFVRKADYDPNDPTSRMKIDLDYQERLLCHTSKNAKWKYMIWEIYGIVFGIIFIAATPKHWPINGRLAPLYTLGCLGIVYDMRRVEEDCFVCGACSIVFGLLEKFL